MPDLDLLAQEANRLLARHGLPLCEFLAPASDQDTANPTVIGEAGGRKYVIKAVFRHPETLPHQLQIANLIREATGLPIPRHLCCADAGDRFPLMVMEWMPGEQLRLVLPALPHAQAQALARDWGRHVARFHHARLPDERRPTWLDPRNSYAQLVEWIARSTREKAARFGESGLWSAEEARAIEEYLAEREPSLAKPQAMGLTKADQDVRDFLAVTEPEPRTSAMIDWERVEIGDTVSETAMIFNRLCVMGLRPLYASFRAGYESEAGARFSQGTQAEYYLMSRSLTASWSEEARANVRALLAGEWLLEM
jgi:aminoglycoside phosphotransferase (APT) family kinase protein